MNVSEYCGRCYGADMAGNESAQDRTEPATEKRLADARRKGDVARSRELNTFAMLVAAIVGLVIFGDTAVYSYQRLTAAHWQISRTDIFDNHATVELLSNVFVATLFIITPFMILMFISTLIGPLLMGGWNFSSQSLKFDVKKLNPWTGFKRMLSIQGLAELLKALVKVILIGGIAVMAFVGRLDEYLLLGELPLGAALRKSFVIFFEISLLMISAMAVITFIDVAYQRWNHGRKLKMTKQEVREEMKETNGNPEVKQRIRSLQQSVAGRRMLLDVPGADVVIVNPTHYSVALKYQEGTSAPVVIAKGVDHLALRIREIAQHSDVEIFSAPPLARALYKNVDIGGTIPTELYVAVAKILAYVLQLKEATQAQRYQLVKPENIEVPENLLDI